jgi:hypothetical protein
MQADLAVIKFLSDAESSTNGTSLVTYYVPESTGL